MVRTSFGTRKEPRNYPEDLWQNKKPHWKQVHGVRVVEVTSHRQECGEADALWTRLPETPIAVVTADCVPILLSHREGKAVAAIHAGWRGVFDQILGVFLKSLPQDLSDPKAWIVKFGPSIHSCCYEVSEELIAQFGSRFSHLDRKKLEPRHRYLDLIAVLTHECQGLGLTLDSVHPECTRCTLVGGELKYFSYRAGDRGSRQYSWIELPKV